MRSPSPRRQTCTAVALLALSASVTFFGCGSTNAAGPANATGVEASTTASSTSSTASVATSTPSSSSTITTSKPRLGASGPPPPVAAPNDAVAWAPVGGHVDGVPSMYTATYPATNAGAGPISAVWLDPKLTRFALHPGTTEPTGRWTTPTAVTAAEQPALLAAFNGGFKLVDSHGGFYLDGQGAATLRPGAATFTIDDTGAFDVGEWGRDVNMDEHLVGARQNLTLLVDGGAPAPNLPSTNYSWGAIFGKGPGTWRSGVGVTADHGVVYVCGANLTANDLALGFVQAGAVRAMELDINHAWVTFNTYQHGDGHVTGTKLQPTMNPIGNRYLNPDIRDFVTVLSRSTEDPPVSAPT